MIPRYVREEMGELWSEESKFKRWLEVELAYCRACREEGLLSEEDWRTIQEKAEVRIERILEIEERTHHDVIAFLEALGENVGPAARFIHLGLTSSDIVDTANALALTRAADVLLQGLSLLLDSVREKACRYKFLVCAGRTHGIHAEPTTFGIKMAVFWAELKRQERRLKQAREEIACGKLSGAVGCYAEVSPEREARALSFLGLKRDEAATQVIQRDRHAALIGNLALLGGTLERMAVEFRHLQRTEVGEVREPFAQGQKGSSAMPHKRNPIVCERISGLARLLRSYALAAMENQALWHERDISHSSVERVIFPDAFCVADYMLDRMTRIVSGLVVNEKRMKEILDSSRGLLYSSRILTALMRKGVSRNAAYEWVQAAAMRSQDEEKSFVDCLIQEPFAGGEPPLAEEEIRELATPEYLHASAEKIFLRLGLDG